jgi:hypothetical protein
MTDQYFFLAVIFKIVLKLRSGQLVFETDFIQSDLDDEIDLRLLEDYE